MNTSRGETIRLLNSVRTKARNSDIHELNLGTSPAVQWLRLQLPMQGGAGSIPGQGAKIPQASWSKSQNIKQKQCGNKFNKDFKNGSHQKKKKLKKISCI